LVAKQVQKEYDCNNDTMAEYLAEVRRFTLSRFVAVIEQPWAFECQLLPMTKGVNSPKMKLFDVVARPESGLTEFAHTLD
jgi:hypothetical protein